MLKNAYLDAKIGVGPAENEPRKGDGRGRRRLVGPRGCHGRVDLRRDPQRRHRHLRETASCLQESARAPEH